MQMRIKKTEKTQSTLFESGQPDSAFFFFFVIFYLALSRWQAEGLRLWIIGWL